MSAIAITRDDVSVTFVRAIERHRRWGLALPGFPPSGCVAYEGELDYKLRRDGLGDEVDSAQSHERQNRQQQDAFAMLDLFRGGAKEEGCEHRATPGWRMQSD